MRARLSSAFIRYIRLIYLYRQRSIRFSEEAGLDPAQATSNMRISINIAFCILLVLAYFNAVAESATRHAATRHAVTKRNYSDQSVRGYLAERTCWFNEVCKEEFHSKFRCRCPRWSYCRAPGRYYVAHCSMTRTGYIWTQPETPIALDPIDK